VPPARPGLRAGTSLKHSNVPLVLDYDSFTTWGKIHPNDLRPATTPTPAVDTTPFKIRFRKECRFDSDHPHHLSALPSEGGGHTFKSCRVRQPHLPALL